MKTLVFAAVLAVTVLQAGAARAPAPKNSQPARMLPEAAIRMVLETQTAAWNRGDLRAFMDGYWNSPDLLFYSGTSMTAGWQQTLERYEKRYKAPGAEMGKLDFSGLDIHMLGPDAAWVGGKWHLKMSDGKDAGGIFTLVFKRLPEGWRIVHDHTS